MPAVYGHDYNLDYKPAMPVVEIQLRRSANYASMLVQAIVDTGSDATMIPLFISRQLQARKGHRKF